MDLKKLLSQTNSKAIYLINQQGNIIDFYSKENKTATLNEKTAAFNIAIFNMSSHFLSTFYNAKLNEIILKADNENILLIKYNEYILAFLSNENLNTSLIELIIKKNLTTT
ncbi:hypothetical protein LNI90_01855 [Tenacibaculum dicentrarchi]|uniref:Roadblock/LAMTOR2 domain-containing protein n=1 Tax=Tenacibaculum dicentrarchi TaxID=669041 RepID=A0ABM9P0X8_9FLAO|nr:hypothetical protein [Tenacibaculum dicentrarchi]MCD8406671.1 hypothetical protein [Tenacibaculum dicentrarchi]MCD8414348.1 hypothetical protein [Tenacibaculum dicentrarchi]MCD8419014.1 hypothetical protein [Tenacibaculum dicentrarchi]MCD8424021.1 hypothetical protein [Tenacibaculum dicentrarchi]